MIPKEKAIQLVDNFRLNVLDYDGSGLNSFKAKQCALIAVDEILNTRPGSPYPHEIGLEVNGIYNQINYPTKYWEDVKQEIELL